MVENPQARQPRLNEAQRLWLLELGLDRPMLARLAPRKAGTASKTAMATVKAAHPPVQADRPDDGAERAGAQALAASAALSALRANRDRGELKPARELLGQVQGPEGGVPQSFTQDAASAAPSDWAALEARIQSCATCGLHAGRHKAVPGAGSIKSVDWLVVGEAPGDRDDRLGEPFQGKAGELLHAMLRAAGIDFEQKVFYTNLVKCRPRSGRPPSADEIAACMPHLRAQVALLRPRGILALGRLAAQALVADGKPFEEQRGVVHAFELEGGQSIPLVVTYHPASLLSRPRHKAAGWRDLNLALGL